MAAFNSIKSGFAWLSVLAIVMLGLLMSPGRNMDSKPFIMSPKTNSVTALSVDHFCLEWDQDTLDIDDWWTHHPEFVIELQNSTHQCFRKEFSIEKSLFFTQVYNNQFPTECDTVLTRNLKNSGWGADFKALSGSLLAALSENKPVVFIPDPKQRNQRQVWQYAANKDGSAATCPSKDFHCYFLPTSKCKPNQTRADQVGTRKLANAYLRDTKTWPWAYQYLTRGQQWIRRAVVDFVDSQRPTFSPDEACTVIHVRRGDIILQKKMPRGKESRGYHPISAYLDLLPNERRQSGSNIVLLTDDANAIDEALDFHSEISWHWVNRTRKRGSEGGFMNHIVEATPKDEVVAILGTLEIAKQCDAVVRGVSSFGDLILDQVRDAWKEKGQDVISVQLTEVFADDQDRMKSDQLLHEKLEKMRADKVASPEPSATVVKSNDLVGDASVRNDSEALEWWKSAGHELSRVYAAREDKTFGWCSPSGDPNHIKGLYYIKLPKCASSTGAAVTLNVANNVAHHKNVTQCHVVYDHVKTQRQALRTRDRHDSILWTTVRHPAKRLVSQYFFRLVTRLGHEPTDSEILKCSPSKKNFQLNQLRAGNLRGYTLAQIMEEMDFIAIAERLDESMAVFTLLFGLRAEDVIVLSAKQSGLSYDHNRHTECRVIVPSKVSPAVDRYLSTSFVEDNLDYVLYAAANASLDKTMDSLGRERVMHEVERHRYLQQLVENECLSVAKFPCSQDGKPQFEEARLSCLDDDMGCGHECVTRVLSSKAGRKEGRVLLPSRPVDLAP